MDSIEFNSLFCFLHYCLFNYIITKIDDSKIERQINTEIFLKLVQYQMMKSKKINLYKKKKIKVKLALPVNWFIDFLKFNNKFF
jgi:hypothetical protein